MDREGNIMRKKIHDETYILQSTQTHGLKETIEIKKYTHENIKREQ